jgi:hypothetical protein
MVIIVKISVDGLLVPEVFYQTSSPCFGTDMFYLAHLLFELTVS